uniref:Uncharacterized protein n=1 Tax=Anguilla anguilla TaxID=7936 RepID=A0A0E9SKY4_ANGAN
MTFVHCSIFFSLIIIANGFHHAVYFRALIDSFVCQKCLSILSVWFCVCACGHSL